MNKIRIVCLLLPALIVSFATPLTAQPFDDDVLDNPVPFDNGVVLLIAVALGYGVKRFSQKGKANK